jgi:hypothetical protein
MLYTGPIHSVAFSNWQRSNLEQLTAYVERLPEDYAHFGMGSYFLGEEGDYRPGVSVHECGTTACFLGHAVAAGVSAPRLEGYPHEIDWSLFSADFVPEGQGLENWAWLFSGYWAGFDDSARGAAQRSRFMLRHEGVPADFLAVYNSRGYYDRFLPIYNQPEYSAVLA